MLALLPMAPIVTAVLLYVLPFEKAAKTVAVAVQAALTAAAFYLFLRAKNGAIVTTAGSYDGALGITLTADVLSSVMIALTAFIFLLAAVYSLTDGVGRLYWFFLFIWQGVICGIFLSGDAFNVFVLLEVIAIVISVLIMYKRDNRSMYDGMVYLMVNSVAMQFFLFGAGYVYKLAGTLDMSAAASAIESANRKDFVLPYALVMTAVSLKCALMPLFGWLPKAHGTPSAPSAVSAVLSGLHIKTGVYLLIRFQEFFGAVSVPKFFLAVGIVTGIGGFVFAVSQTDLKLMLAYSTISQMGLIVASVSIGDAYSYTGGVYHIISHALFKSALFFCAGIIASAYGTRDVREIRGVLRRMPSVGAATAMAVLGITGAPFFNGSISKYFIMSGAGRVVTGAMLLINLGTIVTFIKYSAMLFGRSGPGEVKSKTDYFKQAAILVPSVMCLFGGVFGERAIGFLFGVNVSVDAAGYAEKTAIFALSGAAGYFIYKYFIRSNPLLEKIRAIDPGFRATCASIGAFFAVTALAAGCAS